MTKNSSNERTTQSYALPCCICRYYTACCICRTNTARGLIPLFCNKMKSLLKSFAILATYFTFGCTTAFCEDEKLTEAVKIGDEFKVVEKLLDRQGIQKEERYYSVDSDPDFTTTYYPLRPRLDLVITIKESTGKITFLAIITTPSYRPTKGLEVSIPISSIRIAADGSFDVSIPPSVDKEQEKRQQNKADMATPRKPYD